MNTPTLLLVGGDSPPRGHRNAVGVAAALRYGRNVAHAWRRGL
jgi:hypothetical protein